MPTRKLFERLFVILVLCSLVLSGTAPALAQGPDKYIKKYEDCEEGIGRPESLLLSGRPRHNVRRRASSGSQAPRLASRRWPRRARSRTTSASRTLPTARCLSFPLCRRQTRETSRPPISLYLPIIYASALTGTITGGIRKFVDTLPGLGPAGANNLGQYIPVAVPDTTTYPDSDYYEIALVEYQQQMHSDLPPTKLRGYVQLNGGDRQAPLPGADDRRPEGPPGADQILQPAAHRRRRQPVPPGRHHGHGRGPWAGHVHGRARSAEPDVWRVNPKPAELLHREPGHPAPARRHHALDQRRHAPPVDHPGR